MRQTWKYPVLQTEKSHPVLKFGFQSKSHIFFYLAGRFQTLRFDYKNVLKWDPESRSRFEIQVWNYKKPKILKECPLHEHKNNLKTWISFLDFNLAFCKSPKKNYSVEKIWDRNRKTIKGVLTGKKTHPLNKFFLFRETQISIFDLNFFKTSRINRIRKQTTEFAFAVIFSELAFNQFAKKRYGLESDQSKIQSVWLQINVLVCQHHIFSQIGTKFWNFRRGEFFWIGGEPVKFPKMTFRET